MHFTVYLDTSENNRQHIKSVKQAMCLTSLTMSGSLGNGEVLMFSTLYSCENYRLKCVFSFSFACVSATNSNVFKIWLAPKVRSEENAFKYSTSGVVWCRSIWEILRVNIRLQTELIMLMPFHYMAQGRYVKPDMTLLLVFFFFFFSSVILRGLSHKSEDV